MLFDGEEAGTRGNLGDEENRERQSVNRFLEKQSRFRVRSIKNIC
jgi:hypothetical protein